MNGPTLPSEADLALRQLELVKARREHVWDWSWPPGCATLRRLPGSDRYGLSFIAKSSGLMVKVRANRAALALSGVEAPGHGVAITDDLAQLITDLEAEGSTRRPRTIGGYSSYFKVLKTPPLLARLSAHPEERDLLFAWQRVAGANPMTLRRVTRALDDFEFGEAQWSALMGSGRFAESLERGRVFAVDYGFLHGATTNRYMDREKHLYGTRALFTSEGGPLRPLGVQLAPGGRVFTPSDGVAWRAAQYCFQVADANVHETMEHLGATHMVMEAVGIAARRQLSERHPLRALVEAHIVGTFAINESAKTSLIAPEGVIDRVFAARIDVAASLVRRALDGVSLQDRAPAIELRARGVDDPETLPEYPYRDDVLRVYAAIERFARDFVEVWYPDDAAVSSDPELRAWVDEAGSPIGGALSNVRPVHTREELAVWLANIIHIASAQHAAVNFPQFDFFGWGANIAGSCWAPAPGLDATEDDLLALMPPWDCLFLQSDTVYQLAGVYHTRLGEYELDPRVGEALARFNAELASVERAIDVDNATRRLDYSYLKPSLIPASINI